KPAPAQTCPSTNLPQHKPAPAQTCPSTNLPQHKPAPAQTCPSGTKQPLKTFIDHEERLKADKQSPMLSTFYLEIFYEYPHFYPFIGFMHR
ncbi:hypothetical protein, partial [Bartonella acomydis]|uniref:hypothetical protein n=1 Tax=Bartonella acomydis TaxID=686234 RepID=UPI0031E904BE